MWVNFRESISILVLCLILCNPINGFCSEFKDNITDIKAGSKLIENFYTCITSGIVSETCSNIFFLAPYRPQDESKTMWKYLLKNKKLFIPQNSNAGENDFFKRSRKTISYFNPPSLDNVTDGQLYITIVHTLSNNIYSGIYKEIAFPIIKDDKSGDYKIQFFNIKVNGIIINYDNNFVRDFDIIEALGFKMK